MNVFTTATAAVLTSRLRRQITALAVAAIGTALLLAVAPSPGPGMRAPGGGIGLLRLAG